MWISDEDVENGDIVTYVPTSGDSLENIEHYGIVESENNFISKWNDGPLAKHKFDHCPYYIDNPRLIYYRWSGKTVESPTMTGSDYLSCSGSRTYTLKWNDKAANNHYSKVTWTLSSNLVKIQSSGDTTITVSPSSSSVWGSGTVTAKIDYCGFSKQVSKTVWIGKPTSSYIAADDGFGIMEISTCETISAEAYYSKDHNIIEYEWDMPYASDWEITEEYGGGGISYRYVEVDYWEDPVPSYETIKIRARNSCGWSDWKSTTWSVDDCGGYYMMMSPNPADDLLTLSFMSKEEIDYNEGLKSNTNSEVTRNWRELPEYEVLILHEDKGLIKKLSSQDKQLEINTANLEPGMYFVHLIIEGKKYEDKLIIKR